MKFDALDKSLLLNMLTLFVAACLFTTVAFADCFEKSALWRFEEQGAPFSGAINPQGTLSGTCIDEASCPVSVTGKYGAALRFHMNADGESGSGINVAASPQGGAPFDWAAQDSFSIEFWMMRSGNDLIGHEVIIGRDTRNVANEGANDEIHWWIGVDGGNGTVYARFDGRPFSLVNDTSTYIRGENNKAIFSRKIVNNNTWHHIVFVRDAKKNENRLYVDGELEDMTTVIYENSDSSTAFASTAANLNIGWLNLSRGFHYQGLIDELAIYDMALPAWHVEHLYLSDERADPCE